MHATIRRYRGVAGTTGESVRMISELATNLSKVRGFVSCFALETEPGVLTQVSIFEDLSDLEEADRLIGNSLLQYEHREELQVASGEIVFQRGL